MQCLHEVHYQYISSRDEVVRCLHRRLYHTKQVSQASHGNNIQCLGCQDITHSPSTIQCQLLLYMLNALPMVGGKLGCQRDSCHPHHRHMQHGMSDKHSAYPATFKVHECRGEFLSPQLNQRNTPSLATFLKPFRLYLGNSTGPHWVGASCTVSSSNRWSSGTSLFVQIFSP